MADMKASEEVTMDAVKSLLLESGYEITTSDDENCAFVKDTDSEFIFTCVLENNILFNTVACIELEKSAVTQELMEKLLNSENGISTSNFQLYRADSNKTIISLNNFCKLQDLGPEDQDDILSCLEFLNVDVLGARALLGEFI